MRAMRRVFETFLSLSRMVIAVPIVVLVLLAVAAFAYGVAVFVNGIIEVVAHPFPVGNKIGLFLLDIDLFLIGATLLIAAIGFYELFFERIGTAGGSHMPAWLRMDDLDDLKARVIAMTVLILAVSFVEFVVDDAAGLEVLELGGGIALTIGALTAFVRFGGRDGLH
ncbi:MAG: YqhA family protein [Candidatus Dormibacteria bacterium]